MASPTDPSRTGGRRLPWRGLVVLVVVALVGLFPLARHLLDRQDELLATNTRSFVSPSAETLRPGARSCTDVRRDDLLDVPAGTTAVRVFPGYTNLLAPRLTVELSGRGATVRGRGPADYPSGQPLVLRLEREVPKELRRVCVRNAGPSTVTLARAVDAGGNDREVPLDQGGPTRTPQVRNTVRFDLLGRRGVVAVALVGQGLDNASAYKPEGVSPLLIGAGLVLVLLGAGGAILFVGRAPEDEEPGARVRTSSAGGTPPADTSAAANGGSRPGARTERGGW